MANGRCSYREAEVYKSRRDNRLLQVPIHSQVKLWWRHGHIICSCVATEEHVLLFLCLRVSLTCLGENALLVSDLEQNIDSRGPEKQ